jgi:chloride channel protein, CIC family
VLAPRILLLSASDVPHAFVAGEAGVAIDRQMEPSLTDAPAVQPPDARTLLATPQYLALMTIGAITGVPVAVVAYFFLKAVAEVQNYVFATLPSDLGFDGQPAWWPMLPLTLSGILVALAIVYLPGTGGHEPANGFKAGGPVPPIELFGIAIAAFATLSLGVVLGPEAPLIAIGSGMGVLVTRLLKRDAPEMAVTVIAAAGSFAAISTLLGSPLAAAFLLLEAAAVGGAMTSVVLVPGLLAAGVGALVYVGLDTWTGFGTFSLAISDLPDVGSPTVAQLLWAVAIGVAGAIVGTAITRLARYVQPIVERRRLILTPIVGLTIGVIVFVFVVATDRSSAFVLFSGQDQLAPLISGAAGWSVGALSMLVVCKALAYGAALTSFRGGPVFPAIFIGAAGGILLSHLPGLPMIAGVAMGMGAMIAAMLGLPLVSVLIVALFLQDEGLQLTPVVIIAVVVSYVTVARLDARHPPGEARPVGGETST